MSLDHDSQDQIPAPQSSGAVPDHAWRKFHKVTPISEAGVMWVILAIILFNFAQNISWDSLSDIGSWLRSVSVKIYLAVAGGLLLLTLLVIGFAAISWKFKSYAVVESGVHLRQGILMKQHQHTRWDRIQSVEIEQKLFGRIFGFGSVVIEAAGAGESATRLGLLRMEDCGLLRQEVLTGLNRARAGLPVTDDGAGVDMDPSPVEAHAMERAAKGDPALPVPGAMVETMQGVGGARGVGTASEDSHIPIYDPDDMENDRLIFELPTGRLIASSILSPVFIFSLISIAVFVGLSLIAGEAAPGILIFVITAGLSFIESLLSQYNTRVFLSENGLRHRAGLTRLVTKTIPPHRIHGIRIDQPLLWKFKGWWRMEISMAGMDVEDSTELLGKLYLCPVGSREDIDRLLWTVLPSLGSDDDAALFNEALNGHGPGRFFAPSVPSAKWLDPIQWKSRGLALTPRVFIAREGRFTRAVYISAQDRNQSLKLTQGPLQRRLSLATLEMDMVLGTNFNVRAKNFEERFLEDALWKQSELTADARNVGVTESLGKWRQRVGV